MSAQLVVHPGREIASWGEFVSSHPPYSVALDGYVIGAPEFAQGPDGPHANLDHHYGVNRLATLSTAQQALRFTRLGMVAAFTSPDGDYSPTLYVNDCDQDVALGVHLLTNAPDIAAQRHKRQTAPLRNLVDMAGDLDVTAGAYPYPSGMRLMREVAWMFRPFTEFRDQGGVARQNAEEFRQIIGECAGRIGLHLAGRGGEVKLDMRYEEIKGGSGWTMFREVGPEGRIGAFANGIKAYVIHKGQREDGMHDYTIGRSSELVPFDVHGAVALLNAVEDCPPNAGWGCASSGTVGGSPRLTGSQLAPAELQSVLNTLTR
ncbi:MAG TPA: hypothetical protein VLF62_01355 [Candidatus Saccharimonadales bacterium]|nr:hypothetical protein [Candidatus Saccharimonadales bacterium]